MFGSLFGGASSNEVDAIAARICVLLDLLEPLLNKDLITEVKPALDKDFQLHGELWNDPVEDCIQIGVMTDHDYMLGHALGGASLKLPTIRVKSFLIMGHSKLATLLITGFLNDDNARWSMDVSDRMMVKATKFSKLVAQKLTKMPGWRAAKMFDITVISRA